MKNNTLAIVKSFGRALKSFVYDASNPNHWSSGQAGGWLPLQSSDAKYRRVNAFANSIVTACLAWSTRNFRQATLTLLRETKPRAYEQVVTHPALDLLRSPNLNYGAKVLWIGTLISYHLDGNAYWIKIRNARGRGLPVELYYAPHWCMRPVWTPGSPNWIDYYEYTFEGRYMRFAPEDVVHFRNGVDPFNPRMGYAPLKSVLAEIFTDEEAARFTAALLGNMAVPGLVVTPEGDATIEKEDADNLIEKIKRRFGGDKRGEPFVASKSVKVTTLGFTPEELNLESLRKVPADRVLAVLGIPGAVVGLGSGQEASTYNNLRNFQRQAFEQHLVPTWDDFAEEITTQLLTDFDNDPQLLFDFDTSEIAALREDEDAIHKRAKEALDAGGITLNEYRALIGQQPDPHGDYYLRISSKAPVTAIGAAEQAGLGLFSAFFTTAEHLDAGQIGPQTPQQLAEKALRAIAAAQMKRLTAGADETLKSTQSAYKSLDEDIDQTARGAQSMMADALSSAFVEMASDIPSEVAAIDLSDVVRAGEVIGTRVIDRRVELFVDAFKGMHSRIEQEIQRHVRRALETETVTSESAAASIARNNAGRVAGYTSDLKQQTINAVREAILAHKEGETVDQIAKRISQHVSGRQMYPGVFDQARQLALTNGADSTAADAAGEAAARQHRAQLIAETESRVSTNRTLVETLDAAGVKKVLVHDGADCGWEYHEQQKKANGMMVTLAEARRFPISHPRCQRRFTPIIEQ